jgi:hypothetical protein
MSVSNLMLGVVLDDLLLQFCETSLAKKPNWLKNQQWVTGWPYPTKFFHRPAT